MKTETEEMWRRLESALCGTVPLSAPGPVQACAHLVACPARPAPCFHKVVRGWFRRHNVCLFDFCMVLSLAHVHPIENVWHVCGDGGVIHMHVA